MEVKAVVNDGSYNYPSPCVRRFGPPRGLMHHPSRPDALAAHLMRIDAGR